MFLLNEWLIMCLLACLLETSFLFDLIAILICGLIDADSYFVGLSKLVKASHLLCAIWPLFLVLYSFNPLFHG